MLTKLVKTVLLLGILITPISTARAADVSVTLTVFHDRLAPYGEWVSVNRYGSCWRPRHVVRAWRPYTVGHWVYSDYGWTWVSDESWGWATYHYGRWVDDPYYGWIWVPDETWGPAYVAWRYGDGWIGWAPLPPGIGLSAAVDIDRYVQPTAYAFVQAQYFPDPQIRTHIVADARNGSLIPVTRNVTRYDSGGGRIVDRGVDPREVERVSGHRMLQLQVRDTSDPHASRARVANNELMVYRPSAANREAGRPAAQPRSATEPHAQAQRGEPLTRARGTTGHVVSQPPQAEQPQRRSAQSRERTTQAPRSQRSAQPQRAQQAGQQAAQHERPAKQQRAAQQQQAPQHHQQAAQHQQPAQHQQRAAEPQQRAAQQQHRAQPQVDQHSRAAARHQPAPPRGQPAPVATSGSRPSKPSAAPKTNQTQKHNAPPQKDKKKKGGS